MNHEIKGYNRYSIDIYQYYLLYLSFNISRSNDLNMLESKKF